MQELEPQKEPVKIPQTETEKKSEEIPSAETEKKSEELLKIASEQKSEKETSSESAKIPEVVQQTELEKQWTQRLGPLFGTANIRSTAALSEDKSNCRLEQIEHLALGLNFTVNKQQQLMCKEFNGYYLSTQQSLAALNGLPSIIILENDQGDKKYLIPDFSLSAGEKNNAFNQENIIDYGSLCNKKQPYYAYTFNKHNELEGESVESNLYLAILYRSQGDFERAIKCLENCKTHKNINAAIVAIALQVLKRKIQSPMGAAFDLKLACYLKEHQQKWSKDKEQLFEPVQFPDNWEKWLKTQLEFYKNTFSSYKLGVAIIPSFCRLTEYELALLSPPPEDAKNTKNPNDSKKNPAEEAEVTAHSKRAQAASRLPDTIITDQGRTSIDNWRTHVAHLDSEIRKDINWNNGLPHRITSLRLYAHENKSPTINFLWWNFEELFKDAISLEDGRWDYEVQNMDAKSRATKRLDRLRKKLFALLQNDADPKPELFELISLLAFASKFPHYFTDFKIPVTRHKFSSANIMNFQTKLS